MTNITNNIKHNSTWENLLFLFEIFNKGLYIL